MTHGTFEISGQFHYPTEICPFVGGRLREKIDKKFHIDIFSDEDSDISALCDESIMNQGKLATRFLSSRFSSGVIRLVMIFDSYYFPSGAVGINKGICQTGRRTGTKDLVLL